MANMISDWIPLLSGYPAWVRAIFIAYFGIGVVGGLGIYLFIPHQNETRAQQTIIDNRGGIYNAVSNSGNQTINIDPEPAPALREIVSLENISTEAGWQTKFSITVDYPSSAETFAIKIKPNKNITIQSSSCIPTKSGMRISSNQSKPIPYRSYICTITSKEKIQDGDIEFSFP